MARQPEKQSTLRAIGEYFLNLRDPSPYWRVQAAAWGVVLVVLVVSVLGVALIGLSGVFGGGAVPYEAVGSPGPVVFNHSTHMAFQDGKYKDCKTCHDKLFAAQRYGTYVIRALRDSPPRKVRIGKDNSTLYIPGTLIEDELARVTYEVPRACATCATGNCHDGKESFARLDCLSCHRAR